METRHTPHASPDRDSAQPPMASQMIVPVHRPLRSLSGVKYSQWSTGPK